MANFLKIPKYNASIVMATITQHPVKRLFPLRLERKFSVNRDGVSIVYGKVTVLRTAQTQESVAIVRANTTSRYVHEIRKLKIRNQPNSRKMKNVQQPRQEFARVPSYFKLLEREQRTA
jgi:hypothetical protein